MFVLVAATRVVEVVGDTRDWVSRPIQTDPVHGSPLKNSCVAGTRYRYGAYVDAKKSRSGVIQPRVG